MALDRQARILGTHPLSVVVDAHLLLAAELDADGDAMRTGVDGVLNQLLHDRRRSFDDLARGDLIGQLRRKSGDPRGLAS